MRGNFLIAKEAKARIDEFGASRWLSNPPNTGATQLTVIDVNLDPGKGHTRCSPSSGSGAAGRSVLFISSRSRLAVLERRLFVCGDAFFRHRQDHSDADIGSGDPSGSGSVCFLALSARS